MPRARSFSDAEVHELKERLEAEKMRLEDALIRGNPPCDIQYVIVAILLQILRVACFPTAQRKDTYAHVGGSAKCPSKTKTIDCNFCDRQKPRLSRLFKKPLISMNQKLDKRGRQVQPSALSATPSVKRCTQSKRL